MFFLPSRILVSCIRMSRWALEIPMYFGKKWSKSPHLLRYKKNGVQLLMYCFVFFNLSVCSVLFQC